jgi:hypothetical protein
MNDVALDGLSSIYRAVSPTHFQVEKFGLPLQRLDQKPLPWHFVRRKLPRTVLSKSVSIR